MHVFDDWYSYFHALLGLVSACMKIQHVVFPIYMLYQIIEWRLKHDNIVSDVIEYFAGAGVCTLEKEGVMILA